MKGGAPARAGAVTLVFLVGCSSHVEVGHSRDAAAPPKAEAGEGGRADGGVTRYGPPADTVARIRIDPN